VVFFDSHDLLMLQNQFSHFDMIYLEGHSFE